MSYEVDEGNLEHLDAADKLEELSQKLRDEHDCKMIISLNRMRMMDDIDMAKRNDAP